MVLRANADKQALIEYLVILDFTWVKTRFIHLITGNFHMSTSWQAQVHTERVTS